MMREKEIQALIFDFDGLILETEEPIYQSWKELYEGYGFHLPLSKWVEVIGVGTADAPWEPLSELEKSLDRRVEEENVARRLERESELVARQPIRPGVRDILEAARQEGLKLGIASSSHREWVTGHLDRLGLLHLFDCIRTSNDVSRTKPDPELYLAVLDCLNVGPDRAIAFEDSATGMLAAKQAGLYCVVVPTEVTAGFQFEQADLRLDSLAEIKLEGLLDRISGNGKA